MGCRYDNDCLRFINTGEGDAAALKAGLLRRHDLAIRMSNALRAGKISLVVKFEVQLWIVTLL